MGQCDRDMCQRCKFPDRQGRPFVFVHGGTWRFGSAWEYGNPAEMFVKASAHYVAIDFASVTNPNVNGDLGVLAAQVRRAEGTALRSSDRDPDARVCRK